jgi:hypothetical protein
VIRARDVNFGLGFGPGTLGSVSPERSTPSGRSHALDSPTCSNAPGHFGELSCLVRQVGSSFCSCRRHPGSSVTIRTRGELKQLVLQDIHSSRVLVNLVNRHAASLCPARETYLNSDKLRPRTIYGCVTSGLQPTGVSAGCIASSHPDLGKASPKPHPCAPQPSKRQNAECAMCGLNGVMISRRGMNADVEFLSRERNSGLPMR